MTVFTDAELEFLSSRRLGRLATVGADGTPHVVPVAVFFDPEAEGLVIGANAQLADMAATKKFRDAERRPKVAVVVDEGPRFMEVRGEAETHLEDGEEVGSRLGAPFRFSPAWILIRPRRVVTAGIDGGRASRNCDRP